MTKTKSAVSWARKHITGPGKTSHNGRGKFEMNHSKSAAELYAAAKAAGDLALKQGIADNVFVSTMSNSIVIKLKEEFFGHSYRTVVVGHPDEEFFAGDCGVLY